MILSLCFLLFNRLTHFIVPSVIFVVMKDSLAAYFVYECTCVEGRNRLIAMLLAFIVLRHQSCKQLNKVLMNMIIHYIFDKNSYCDFLKFTKQ